MPDSSPSGAAIPVVVFAYNRPGSLAELLACLKRDAVPLIYAFSDGARHPGHAGGVTAVRELLSSVDWCELVLVERRTNLGLGKSLVLGVTEVLDRHEAAIVFEDDLVCVPGTYEYFCAALRHYKDTTEVMSITGWTHPRITPKDAGTVPYFDGRAECWSWATWRRAWTGMEATDAQSLIKECRAKQIWPRKYGDDLPKAATVEHEKNIWAVRWLYWHMVKGGLCLRPPHSLIEHRGTDSTATNVGPDNAGWQNPPLKACPPPPNDWPEAIEHPSCVKLWRKACKDPVEPVSPLRKFACAVRKIVQWPPSKKLALPTQTAGDITFTGDYATWEEASALCEGYASDAIIQRVRAAALRVKDGQAACERDGATFDKADHPWPVLAAIFRAAQRCKRGIRLLDFGGSLGSLYFQTREFLGHETISEWCVVEQPNFVAAGQREFADEILSFHTDGKSCAQNGEVDVLLLSGVIQYIPKAHQLLDEMVSWRPRHIVVDRTPVWPGRDMPDKIALQTVSAVIYPARYPVWFFNRDNFLAHFAKDYVLASEFEARDQFHYQGTTITCQGFVMDRRV